jgi:hypothetical protein
MYKRKFIKVQEIWFDDETIEKVDKVVFNQVPAQSKNAEKFVTLLLNLQESEEEIRKHFKKNNKYEINRAQKKDNLAISIYFDEITDEILGQYFESYNDFARERNFTLMSYPVLKYYVAENKFALSNISNSKGQILIWHSYIVGKNRVRLRTSNSINISNEDKGLIGRANRLLHWKDIQFFKNREFDLYDFGGWYPGKDDQKKSGINAFKESFGGYKEESYNFTRYLTLKGRMFQALSLAKTIISN